MYIVSNSNTNTITNSNIKTKGASENYGIHINQSSHNRLTNNNINTNGTINNHGIYILSSSTKNANDNNLTNNNITTTANESTGIRIERTNYTNITENTIKTTGNLSFAISLVHAGDEIPVNNSIYNNIFNTTDRAVNITSPLTVNNFSIALITATNIIGGANIGGNFYDNSTAGGENAYSLSCVDSNGNGICDTALNHTPDGNNTDYYPIANIVECGTLDTANKIYTLSKSLTAANTCFTVTAASVTIDCNGNTITYATDNQGYGVNIIGVNNTKVQDCIFIQPSYTPQYSTGIYANNSNNSIFTGNTLNSTGNFTSGIQLRNSHYQQETTHGQ